MCVEVHLLSQRTQAAEQVCERSCTLPCTCSRWKILLFTLSLPLINTDRPLCVLRPPAELLSVHSTLPAHSCAPAQPLPRRLPFPADFVAQKQPCERCCDVTPHSVGLSLILTRANSPEQSALASARGAAPCRCRSPRAAFAGARGAGAARLPRWAPKERGRRWEEKHTRRNSSCL